MKFLLTIYICSVVAGKCYTHPDYPKEQSDYYDCVRNGLSESYEILYQGDFSEQDVVDNALYPKSSCEKVLVPLPKPKVEEETTSLPMKTILRGVFRLVTYNIN